MRDIIKRFIASSPTGRELWSPDLGVVFYYGLANDGFRAVFANEIINFSWDGYCKKYDARLYPDREENWVKVKDCYILKTGPHGFFLVKETNLLKIFEYSKSKLCFNTYEQGREKMLELSKIL
jgi:hypothetical protein